MINVPQTHHKKSKTLIGNNGILGVIEQEENKLPVTERDSVENFSQMSLAPIEVIQNEEGNQVKKAHNKISARINKIIDSVRAHISVEISLKDLKVD